MNETSDSFSPSVSIFLIALIYYLLLAANVRYISVVLFVLAL